MPSSMRTSRRSESPAEGMYSQMNNKLGGNGTIIVALLVGAVIALFCRDALPGPSSRASDSVPPEVARLLEKMDMEEYLPVFAARRLTVAKVAISSESDPEEGIKPFHWKRLIAACKSKSASQDDDEPPAPKIRKPRRKPATPPPEPAEEPAGESEATPAPKKKKPKAPKVQVEEEPAEEPEKPAAKKPAAVAPAPATPPPPTPAPTPMQTPVPKPSYPVVCNSWSNTVKIRSLWQKWKSQPMAVVNGTEMPKACASYKPPARELGMTEPNVMQKIPTASVADEKKWLKLGVSLVHVQQLRARGIIDQLYIDEKLKIMYCAVPKSGCTGLKGWMLKGAGLFTGGSAHNKTLFKGPRLRVATYMTDEEVQKVLNNGEYFKFTIVRNPFTRVLATYLERFNTCLQQKRRTAGECHMWKKALTRDEAAAKGLKDDMTFQDYLDSLDKYGPQHKPINFLNAHWLPASQVCAMDEIEYDYVGRLEEKSDMQMVYDFTGQQPEFSASQKKKLQHSEGTDKKKAQYFTEKAHDDIARLYKNWDLDLLGYTSTNVVPGHEQKA